MSSSNKEHHLALSLIGTIFGIIWKPLQNGSSKVILTLVLCYFQKGSSQPEEKLLKTKVRLLRIMMSNIQVTKRFEIYKPLKLFLDSRTESVSKECQHGFLKRAGCGPPTATAADSEMLCYLLIKPGPARREAGPGSDRRQPAAGQQPVPSTRQNTIPPPCSGLRFDLTRNGPVNLLELQGLVVG